MRGGRPHLKPRDRRRHALLRRSGTLEVLSRGRHLQILQLSYVTGIPQSGMLRTQKLFFFATPETGIAATGSARGLKQRANGSKGMGSNLSKLLRPNAGVLERVGCLV
jgi:hypothetical protein